MGFRRTIQKNRALDLEGLGCVVLGVSDVGRAQAFYSEFGWSHAGTDCLPKLGHHVRMEGEPGQSIILHRQIDLQDFRDTGVHTAFRIRKDVRESICDRMAACGTPVHRYVEDRAAEEADNYYALDPDGNRIQLVARGDAGSSVSLDHTAILAFDMLWAEDYYARLLGLEVEHRIGWDTADHARARRWEAGEEDMAPGTRRLDKLYMAMGGKNEVPRANMQMFLRAGQSMLMVYLATKHFQEPPEEQVTGAPRAVFFTKRKELDRAASLLDGARRPFSGPVEHPPSAPYRSSLYLRDPSGNFLEFASA